MSQNEEGIAYMCTHPKSQKWKVLAASLAPITFVIGSLYSY